MAGNWDWQYIGCFAVSSPPVLGMTKTGGWKT